MDVYLAGVGDLKKYINQGLVSIKGIKALESFYEIRSDRWLAEQIPSFSKFLLDSGAFTFLKTKKDANLDWDRYVDAYSEFIVNHNIQRFFELDIDPIIGLKGVERLRKRIEQRTGKQVIPVWHISRGKDYFLSLCRDYEYIAFGGLMTDGVSRRNLEKYMGWFIMQAHQNQCKIHGLGYTSTKMLEKFKFDSVDSTTWKVGVRVGTYCKFDIKTCSINSFRKEDSQRIRDRMPLLINDFKEWIKFQKYAEKYL